MLNERLGEGVRELVDSKCAFLLKIVKIPFALGSSDPGVPEELSVLGEGEDRLSLSVTDILFLSVGQ